MSYFFIFLYLLGSINQLKLTTMKQYSKLFTSIMILCCVCFSYSQNGYLKIGDIKGESTERAHKDWIVIESFSQSLEPRQAAPGSSRQRSAVNFKDLVIVKKLDRATPLLMQMCSKGQIVPELELDMVANNNLYYKITLTNAKITGMTTRSECDPKCQLMDEVSVSFSKINWDYYDSTGQKTSASFNVKTGS